MRYNSLSMILPPEYEPPVSLEDSTCLQDVDAWLDNLDALITLYQLQTQSALEQKYQEIFADSNKYLSPEGQNRLKAIWYVLVNTYNLEGRDRARLKNVPISPATGEDPHF